MLVDPAITGRLEKRDDGSVVKMKFPAPKTQVIGIIVNGVLQQKLNWGLILIGAMLAVGLELCGVGSLAFAVGVYIPMQYTMPIFLGGLIRYAAERFSTRPATVPQDEATAIAEAETGPGVLLSSGYIAGGTLAGVLIAFLQLPFFEKIKNHVEVGKDGEPLAQLLVGGFDCASVLVFGVLMIVLFLVAPTKCCGRHRANKSGAARSRRRWQSSPPEGVLTKVRSFGAHLGKGCALSKRSSGFSKMRTSSRSCAPSEGGAHLRRTGRIRCARP